MEPRPPSGPGLFASGMHESAAELARLLLSILDRRIVFLRDRRWLLLRLLRRILDRLEIGARQWGIG